MEQVKERGCWAFQECLLFLKKSTLLVLTMWVSYLIWTLKPSMQILCVDIPALLPLSLLWFISGVTPARGGIFSLGVCKWSIRGTGEPPVDAIPPSPSENVALLHLFWSNMLVQKPTTASGYGLFSDATCRLSSVSISVGPHTARRYRFAVLELAWGSCDFKKLYLGTLKS